ncbi:MAG TPA: hypothetical protein PKI11_20450, partial [Candidatus Hydrogenedentes bacterium]|nr:hypothetical protein [Candidatus Hydrogenedentota bacterium]
MFGRRKEEQEKPQAPSRGATTAPVPHVTPVTHPDEVTPIPHKRLGEVLLEEEAITRGQLEEALAIQKRDGGFLGQILVKLRYTTQEAVASCLV